MPRYDVVNPPPPIRKQFGKRDWLEMFLGIGKEHRTLKEAYEAWLARLGLSKDLIQL